jgi:PKD repeat protein
MTKRFATLAACLALFTGAACTVHQADSAPPLTGPSGLAQSVTITATPDNITRDGQSRSTIVVRVIDATGQPAAGVSLRMDMLVGGSLVDFGTLSLRTIVTGSDGRATTVYTAPPALPTSSPTSGVGAVTISATPIGDNAQISLPFTTEIRLMPQGVILPPAGTPTASFSISPSSPVAGVPVNFDASASVPGTNAGSITYAWSFGDGTTGAGQTTTHTYASANSFNVTLTVANDRGLSASLTQAVTVAASAPPTPDFSFSPKDALPGDSVFFNGSVSKAAPGRTIVSYRWDFGDGGSATGSAVSHVYLAIHLYTVTMTVTDDLGQSATTNKDVQIGLPPVVVP